jgi:hypothetical protein
MAAQAIFGFIAEIEILAMEVQTEQAEKKTCDELDHAFHHNLLMLRQSDSGSCPCDTTLYHAEA